MSEVSILPQSSSLTVDSDISSRYEYATKTFAVDFQRGCISGFVDNIEALKQSIYFILTTERYHYIIYPFSYGSELQGVTKLDDDIMEIELERRIKEAILEDDRVVEVNNFSFNKRKNKDSVLVRFTVLSIYGSFNYEGEVE